MPDIRLSCPGLSWAREGVMEETGRAFWGIQRGAEKTSPPIEILDDHESGSDKNLLI